MHIAPHIAARVLTVLILEDRPFQRRTLGRQVLALGNTTVIEATSGDEALEAVRRSAPELVIADLETPGMDGITFLRMLAKESANPQLVLTSAHDPSVLRSVDEMARIYGLRVLGAVPEPVSRDLLRSFIDQVRAPDESRARASAGFRRMDTEVYPPERIGEAIAAGGPSSP